MAHANAMPTPMALPGVSKIIAVGSGKGGVGKTTVAVNLAIALSKLGQRVGLIDADIYGPNVPTMMGSSQQPLVGANNQIQPNVAHGIKTISIGYISPGDKPMVMRGPMLHQIIRQFLQQVVQFDHQSRPSSEAARDRPRTARPRLAIGHPRLRDW